jgi:hypothetical protein
MASQPSPSHSLRGALDLEPLVPARDGRVRPGGWAQKAGAGVGTAAAAVGTGAEAGVGGCVTRQGRARNRG